MTTARKNQVRDLVKILLTEKEETRDNDMYLASAYWYRQLRTKGIDANAITGMQMLIYIKNYKNTGLVSFESIRRSRQLIQEMHPELRGKEYEKRHATQEEVKQDLKDYKAESAFDNINVTNTQPKLF
jgi:hypothetical protein